MLLIFPQLQGCQDQSNTAERERKMQKENQAHFVTDARRKDSSQIATELDRQNLTNGALSKMEDMIGSPSLSQTVSKIFSSDKEIIGLKFMYNYKMEGDEIMFQGRVIDLLFEKSQNRVLIEYIHHHHHHHHQIHT